MSYFTCEGDQVHYLEEGTGFPVILLHSLGGSTDMWQTTIAALKPYFKVIAFDANGHGRSGSKVRFSMAGYAANAIALAEHLGLKKFHLLGLSMGARTVVRVAINRPEQVVGLVVADTAPGDSADPEPRVAALKRRIAEIGLEGYAYEYTRSRLMNTTEEKIVDQFAKSVLHTLPDTYIDTFTSILHEDLRGDLGKVRATTLVVVGEHDVSSPPPVARSFVDGIHNARFEVIPNANHLSVLDQPAEFNATVLKFLREIKTPGN